MVTAALLAVEVVTAVAVVEAGMMVTMEVAATAVEPAKGLVTGPSSLPGTR